MKKILVFWILCGPTPGITASKNILKLFVVSKGYRNNKQKPYILYVGCKFEIRQRP